MLNKIIFRKTKQKTKRGWTTTLFICFAPERRQQKYVGKRISIFKMQTLFYFYSIDTETLVVVHSIIIIPMMGCPLWGSSPCKRFPQRYDIKYSLYVQSLIWFDYLYEQFTLYACVGVLLSNTNPHLYTHTQINFTTPTESQFVLFIYSSLLNLSKLSTLIGKWATWVTTTTIPTKGCCKK